MTDTQGLENRANEDDEIQLDQAALDAKLGVLKSSDLTNAEVSVFVVKVSTSNKTKRFSMIKRLNCGDDLKVEFRGYVINCIGSVEHVGELRDITTNQDNRAFYVEADATDFSQSVSEIGGGNIIAVSLREDLNQFNGYIIQLTFGNNNEKNIYAFRYFSAAWSLKNTAGKILSLEILGNQLIAGIDEQPRFQVTSNIDLIQMGEDVFITNIKNFETAMNYHERLIEMKSEATAAMTASSIITSASADVLTRTIGNDKHLMRQLASVYAKGFYCDVDWMAKLKEAAQAAGNWLIQFDAAGNIQIQEDKVYIKELLTLLQNKRVQTVVDHKIFDVDGELTELIQRVPNSVN